MTDEIKKRDLKKVIATEMGEKPTLQSLGQKTLMKLSMVLDQSKSASQLKDYTVAYLNTVRAITLQEGGNNNAFESDEEKDYSKDIPVSIPKMQKEE